MSDDRPLLDTLADMTAASLERANLDDRELKEQGILTDDEFTMQKQRILGS